MSRENDTGRLEIAASILLFVGTASFVLAVDESPPVVAVCEVLKDLSRFEGKSVVVVGRFSHTDEGAWLDAECGFKVQNAGKEFQPSISVSYASAEFSPPPPRPAGFRWDVALLQRKLDQLKPTTKLRVLPDLHYQDEWVAAFGRLETHLPRTIPMRRSDVRVEIFGFGHESSSPAQLVSPDDAFRELK
jgi:hypothetical protein